MNLDPNHNTSLSTRDMEAVHAVNNPWEYGEKHIKCYEEYMEQLFDKLPDNLNVIELGCGEGFFTEILVRDLSYKINSYVGCEISTKAADICRSKLFKYNVKSEVRGGFNFETDLPSLHNDIQEADLIIAVECLYYARPAKKVTEYLHNSAESGTYFMLVDSLGTWRIREWAVRNLGHTLIHKFKYPLYKRSWTSILSQKP